MVDLFISFMMGLFIGFVIGSKNTGGKEQRQVYEARLQEQANTIDYYKRLTKRVVEENALLRKAQEK